MATTIRVKQEKHEAEQDRDEYEENFKAQSLFTNFLQSKIDDLKKVAIDAGAVKRDVLQVVEREWRR